MNVRNYPNKTRILTKSYYSYYLNLCHTWVFFLIATIIRKWSYTCTFLPLQDIKENLSHTKIRKVLEWEPWAFYATLLRIYQYFINKIIEWCSWLFWYYLKILLDIRRLTCNTPNTLNYRYTPPTEVKMRFTRVRRSDTMRCVARFQFTFLNEHADDGKQTVTTELLIRREFN